MAAHVSPFVVGVTAIQRDPDRKRHESLKGPIEGLAVTGSRVPSGEDVVVDVDIEAAEGGIVVSGDVAAPWVGECRRCLSEVGGVVLSDVRELFMKNADLELSYPISNEQIDLTPMARDAVLLVLPLAPLCRDDCKGLCPNCGANWNEGTCDCPAEVVDDRWAALDDLKDSRG